VHVACIDKTVYADGASEEATWLALHSPGGAIQRAMSCDSVISEASIPDIDNVDDVNNKIGQLEFSLQYLRYVPSHFVHVILLLLISRSRVVLCMYVCMYKKIYNARVLTT